MKILIVIDNFASGVAQRVQISLALTLKDKGHVVEFFTNKKEFFLNLFLNLIILRSFLRQKYQKVFLLKLLRD
jgi:hypothetical protein